MLIYLALFSFVAVILYVADLALRRSAFFYYTISICVVLLLAVVAGLRDFSVGVDISVYGQSTFRQALAASSWYELVTSGSDIESLFKTINYVAAQFSSDYHVALFCIELVFLSLVFAACDRLREKIPIWISFPVLLLGYYNLSFNLMRQCLAIGFVLYSHTFLWRDNNIKIFFWCIIISYFFHKTAVIGGVVLLYIYLTSRLPSNWRFFSFLFFIAGCVLVYYTFKVLLESLGVLGGKFSEYVAYGGDSGAKGGYKPVRMSILILGDVLAVGVAVFSYMRQLLSERRLYCYGLIVVFDIFAQMLGGYAGYATRIAMYTCSLHIFYLYELITVPKVSKEMQYLLNGVVLFTYLMIWLRLIESTGNTVPYISDVLGITL